MDAKDVKKLIQYYENENPDCRTEQDYLQSFTAAVQRRVEALPPEKKIAVLLMFIRTTHNPVGLGMYEAFKQNNMSLLNDVIYQSACIEQISNISAWGGDHAFFSCHTLPELLAGNCADRIPLLVPEKLGMCTNGNRTAKAKMNLIMALWYNNEKFISESQKNAEKVLETQLPAADRAGISYLLSLLKENAEAASRELDLFCAGKKKSQEYGATKFKKAFCMEAHGLFNLAHYAKNGRLDGKIKMPEQSNFSQDLALWQRENHCPQGRLFLQYPRPLVLVNILLSVTPPENSLYQPYLNQKGKGKSDWYVDTETYKEAVIARVMENM